MPRVPLLVVLALVSACSAGVDDPQRTPSPLPTASPSPPPAPVPSPSPTPTPTPSPSPVSADDLELALEEVATGLSAPLLVTAPPGSPDIWVLEQPGTVRLMDGDEPELVLDITDRVRVGRERGLLGLAFHPDYATNGRVFIHYTGSNGETVLSEFSAADDGDEIDPGSEQVLLTVPQPAANHNGGSVVFGPDGYLYLALGDGGRAGDRFGNGQDPSTLLAAILRLDVSDEGDYAIPPGNPFADGEDGAPEVYAFGLRNPYRIAFGPDGTLYIADVGQNEVEEVNAIHHEDAAGANFGWPILEGSSCYQQADCDPDGTVLPVAEYTQAATGGCAIIGGAVYQGDLLPALRGHYLYSDLCAGFLRSVLVEDGEVVDEHDWTDQTQGLGRVLSIGQNGRGEVYVTEEEGRVLRLVPAGG